MKAGPPANGRNGDSFGEPPPDLDFTLRSFAELNNRELHDLLRLRIDVFVVEQECPYPELDGHDPEAMHLLGRLGSELIAYGRWYLEGDIAVLGRILTRIDHRRRGLARALVAAALDAIGEREVRICAQTYLEGFYRELGFETVSEPYDDHGIAHVDMVRRAGARRS